MMLFVLVLSATFVASSARAEIDALQPDPELVRAPANNATVPLKRHSPISTAGEDPDGQMKETFGTEGKTFKMSKKGLTYLMAGLVLKALAFIKIALAKLTFLGNISIIVSKLSLLLSVILAFGKYFGGISKMLKLRTIGYDGQHHGYYSGLQNHGNYLT